MGRTPIEIDWPQFDRLCAIQCTLREIAAWFKCSEDSIERACAREHGRTFADVFAEKRQVGMMSLRRKQYESAMADGRGAITMQIWLGKQWLKQTDRMETDNRHQVDTSNVTVTFESNGREIVDGEDGEPQ